MTDQVKKIMEDANEEAGKMKVVQINPASAEGATLLLAARHLWGGKDPVEVCSNIVAVGVSGMIASGNSDADILEYIEGILKEVRHSYDDFCAHEGRK